MMTQKADTPTIVRGNRFALNITLVMVDDKGNMFPFDNADRWQARVKNRAKIAYLPIEMQEGNIICQVQADLPCGSYSLEILDGEHRYSKEAAFCIVEHTGQAGLPEDFDREKIQTITVTGSVQLNSGTIVAIDKEFATEVLNTLEDHEERISAIEDVATEEDINNIFNNQQTT